MEDRFKIIEDRVAALESHATSMMEWRKSVEENTEAQREVAQVGKDIIAAMRVIGWVGSAIKWLAGTAVAIAGLISLIKRAP